MKIRRIAAFLLAALTFAAIFVCSSSCGTSGNPIVPTDTDVSGREARLAADDGLGDVKFTGKKWRVSCTDICRYEMFSDDITDICGAAIHRRNLKIEDRFDIEMIPVVTVASGSGEGQLMHERYVRQALDSGDDEFDAIMMQVWRAGTVIVDGYFADFNDGSVPGINLSRPWWSKEVNDTFTINGMLFAAVGDISVTALQQTYAYMLNKRIASDYNIADLYDVVRSGEWTIDYVSALVKDIYEDYNRDGERDGDDVYGFMTGTVHDASAYLYAFGLSLTGKKDGYLDVVLDERKANDTYEKIFALFYETNGAYTLKTDKEYKQLVGMFTSGKALLSPQPLSRLYDKIRDMEDPYGVLPYPKYNDKQKDYYSGTSNNWSVFCVPAKAKDPELAGYVAEALCCENYRTVITAYYDKALKDKYTDADDDEEMLDILLAGKRSDLALLFGPSMDGVNAFFRYQLQAESRKFASEWASKKMSFSASIAKIEQQYDKMAAAKAQK